MSSNLKNHNLSLRFSVLALSIMAISTHLSASATQNTNAPSATVTKNVVDKAAADRQQETAPKKIPFTGASNNNLFPLQSHSVRQGAGRFGENRSGGRSHGGIDINYASANNKNEEVVAINNGKVVSIGNPSGVYALVIKLDNGDYVSYLHNQSILVKSGQEVKRGQPVATMGGRTGYAVHLHLSYGVKPQQSFAHHMQQDTMGSIYQGSGAFKSIINNYKDGLPAKVALTNPAPYLPDDIYYIFTNTSGPDHKMNAYLGNTARTHWNALYSKATGVTLPVPGCIQTRGGCSKPQLGKPFPAVALKNGSIGNMDAYGAANAAVAQGLADGSIPAEYANKDVVSSSEIARYLKPRTIFGGNAEEVAIDVGDFQLSPSEQISKIGKSRFGDAEWAKNLTQMSMRGMLTEYLNMTVANNYLTKEHYKQQERIEGLLAAYVAQRAQRFSGYVDRAYAAAEDAKVNAAVSTMPLEQLFDPNADLSNIEDSADYSAILANATGEVPRICKGGINQHSNLRKYPELLPNIKRVALKHGFNPNDLAAVIGFESGGFNPLAKNSLNHATGLMQWLRIGLSGITQSNYQSVGLYPKYKPVQVKSNYWGLSDTDDGHRKVILSMSVAEQMMLADAYLSVKIKENKRWRAEYGSVGLKDIRHLYPLVLGSATYVSPSENYNQNKGMDTNKDGKITPAEAALSPKFHSYLCQYFPDFP